MKQIHTKGENNLKVKVMLDKTRHADKPERFGIVKIQGYTSKKDGIYHYTTLVQTELTIPELADSLVNGATFRPALLKEFGTKKEDWISQNVFALDFDHNTTIEDELQKCNTLGVIPVFGYTSFSHSEKEHRFRLVFVTKEVITDLDTRNKLQCTLINLFNNSDQVAFNEDRIFFGGKGKVPIQPNYAARIDADKIISKYFDEEYIIKMTKPKNRPSKSKNKSVNTDKRDRNVDYMLNVDAIKNRDIEKLRSLIKKGINEETLELHSEQEVYDFINSIDLNAYLGISQGEKINCILPDHEDNNPSAHIFITKSGTPVYKCFGCDTTLTIIGLTEDLTDMRRHQAINFIKEVYNVKLVQSDWALQQKQLMIDSANYLDTEEFKVQFPHIAKLIRTRKAHIQLMLMHFTQHVSDKMQYNNKPMFFASLTKLMEVCQIKDKTRLSQSITLFTLLNMLDKVELENIPEEELKKAKHISAQYGFKKLTNFYQFEEYDRKTLKSNDDIAKNLIDNNVSLKGISREYVLRTFGTDKADKVYPQFKHENKNGTSSKSDALTMEIAQFILDSIEQNGYVIEKDIKVSNRVETQWKRSIQEVLDTYGLIRVKANKVVKSKHNIQESISYQSFVIVKDE